MWIYFFYGDNNMDLFQIIYNRNFLCIIRKPLDTESIFSTVLLNFQNIRRFREKK